MKHGASIHPPACPRLLLQTMPQPRVLGQAAISLVNTRVSFFRSVDIKLLIVVGMPGWRLFVSLETAIEPGWNIPSLAVLPQQGGCGHLEQETQHGWTLPQPSMATRPHPLPRSVLMSQGKFLDPQIPGRLTAVLLSTGKCSLLPPWVLSRARLGNRVRGASAMLPGDLVNRLHFPMCRSKTWLRGNEFGGSLGCPATAREPGC